MIKTTKTAKTGKYENTLCGCFQDFGVCCITWYIYPYAEGLIWAEARGEVCTCCHFRLCGNGMFIRANVRRARGMEQNLFNDCMTYSFCWRCALMQDWREIKLINAQNIADGSTENKTETDIIISDPPQNSNSQTPIQNPELSYPNQYQNVQNSNTNQYINPYQNQNVQVQDPYQNKVNEIGETNDY